MIRHFWTIWKGISNFYSFADNYGRLGSIAYILKYSLALTLASKYKLKSAKGAFRKYGTGLEVRNDKSKVIASFPNPKLAKPKTWGGFSGSPLLFLDKMSKAYFRSRTLLEADCLVCGSQQNVEVHHVKHLRKGNKGDYWLNTMRNMNRKQIPVCRACHHKIHSGQYSEIAIKRFSVPE